MTLARSRKISVEARVDARSLATIASAFSEKNIPITSRSQLVSTIIETFCDSLVSSKVVTAVDSTAKALQILDHVGIRFTDFSRRNLRALALQIQSERALDNLVDVEQLDEELTPALIDEALQKYQSVGSRDDEADSL